MCLRVSTVMLKHQGQKQCGKERVISSSQVLLHGHSPSLRVVKGTEAETMEES